MKEIKEEDEPYDNEANKKSVNNFIFEIKSLLFSIKKRIKKRNNSQKSDTVDS